MHIFDKEKFFQGGWALVAEQRRSGLDAMVLTGSMHPWETSGLEEIEVDGKVSAYSDHYGLKLLVD